MHYYYSFAGKNYVLSAYYRNGQAGYRLRRIGPPSPKEEPSTELQPGGTVALTKTVAQFIGDQEPKSFTIRTGDHGETQGWFLRWGNRLWLHMDGCTWGLVQTKWEADGAVESKLTADMPGKVINVYVQPGQAVTKGDTLLILEAMKMETPVRAPADGKVSQLHVATGELVEGGKVLAELEYE